MTSHRGQADDRDLLRAALSQVGVEDEENLLELTSTRLKALRAIPAIIDVLPKLRHEGIKEGLVRALTTRLAYPSASEALIRELRLAQSETYGWTVGNALSVASGPEHFDAIAAIARDRRLGIRREPLMELLIKSGNESAAHVVIGLLDDPIVQGHAVAALARIAKKDPAARAAAARFVDHPEAWVRRTARRAL